MRIYTCLIVDDEPIARGIVEEYCSHMPYLRVVKSCANAMEAKHALQEQDTHIMFLDVNMPVLDGLSFLRTLTKPPVVILETAYREHAIKAFDLFVCDYLLKPFSLERFIIAVDRAVERLGRNANDSIGSVTTTDDHIFIKAGGKLVKVRYDELLFAEAQGNFIKIVTTRTTLLAGMTFTSFEQMLPGPEFLRVHRSYIVNRSKITHVEGSSIFIDRHEIPIGSNYKEAFMKSLK